MNPAAPIQHVQTQPHHGIKRSAPNDEVEQSSNISTHFKKLRLNNQNNNIHIVSRTSTSAPSHQASNGFSSSPVQSHEHIYNQPPLIKSAQAMDHASPSPLSTLLKNPPTPIIPPRTDDFMPLDDTPHRIYISDLDAEIAAIESQEALDNIDPSAIFLPDFDKNISKIPDHVLRGSTGTGESVTAMINRRANEQALVLYRDPTSITVPEEEDAVRKTIIAARKEAREKMKRDHERSIHAGAGMQNRDSLIQQQTNLHGDSVHMDYQGAINDEHNDNNDDDDAMDIG